MSGQSVNSMSLTLTIRVN